MQCRKCQTENLADSAQRLRLRVRVHLLAELSSIVRNECAAAGGGADRATFAMVTTPNETQRRALDLLETIREQASSES